MNTKIAESLGMTIPDEIQDFDALRSEFATGLHEITIVDNPDLPKMTDIDLKLLEGEKQLEAFILKAFMQIDTMFKDAGNVSPDKKARYLEIASYIMERTFNAIKHKNEIQLKKKDMRMKEHKHSNEKSLSNPSTTNNIFVGTREEMRKHLKEIMKTA